MSTQTKPPTKKSESSDTAAKVERVGAAMLRRHKGAFRKLEAHDQAEAKPKAGISPR